MFQSDLNRTASNTAVVTPPSIYRSEPTKIPLSLLEGPYVLYELPAIVVLRTPELPRYATHIL